MSLTIDNVRLDDPQRPYIIAEISANHGGNLAKAAVLIEAAATAGADAVKFQTFTAEEIAAPNVLIPRGVNAKHDAWLSALQPPVRTLRDLFRTGGLPRAWHADLAHIAKDHGISFLSTPFSVDAARFLVDEIGVPGLKIASGDLTFAPLLQYVANTGLPVILSTGASTFDEISKAVRGSLEAAYRARLLAILHCVSQYPCPLEKVNLRAITRLKHSFDAPIGWSDHTLSIEEIPALAVSLGATIIEKHLTLDYARNGPDTLHSLGPCQFARMVEVARSTPAMLGDGIKRPLPAEQHDRLWARRAPADWLRPTLTGRQGEWE